MRALGLLLLLLLTYSPQTFSMLYSGVITKVQTEIRIKEARLEKTFALSFASPQIEKMVRQLAPNDFISFDGARSSETNTIRVDSINYVGLATLLKTWQGDDNYCYSFTSFTEMKIYLARAASCKFTPVVVRKYAYTINPGSPDWMILLSDNQGNYIADLSVKNERAAEISLYDSNTGDILRVIKLRK